MAALRAAQWAVSDRQAALVLAMPVQQRLVTGEQLQAARAEYVGRRRRALVATLIDDIADGAHSLGELDFGALCRRRGLPAPERQVVVSGPDGRCYLDVRWREGPVVEIDGRQHRGGLAPVQDMLRQNSVSMSRDMVLRIPLIGLRLEPEAFLGQRGRAEARQPPREGSTAARTRRSREAHREGGPAGTSDSPPPRPERTATSAATCSGEASPRTSMRCAVVAATWVGGTSSSALTGRSRSAR